MEQNTIREKMIERINVLLGKNNGCHFDSGRYASLKEYIALRYFNVDTATKAGRKQLKTFSIFEFDLNEASDSELVDIFERTVRLWTIQR